MLGIGGDATVRVEASDDAVGLGQDLAALLDERTDLLDELVFIALVFGFAFFCVDSLYCSRHRQ